MRENTLLIQKMVLILKLLKANMMIFGKKLEMKIQNPEFRTVSHSKPPNLKLGVNFH